MKELNASIKRIYSRLVALTAVVIFGAIAIAQAQREGGQYEPPLTGSNAAFAESHPIPLSTDISLPPAADATVADEYADTTHEQVGWNEPTDNSEFNPEGNSEETYADESLAEESFASDSRFAEEDEPATLALPPSQSQPELPDVSSATETRRRNPFRGDVVDETKVENGEPMDELPGLPPASVPRATAARSQYEEPADDPAAPPLLDDDLPPQETDTYADEPTSDNEAEDSRFADDPMADESSDNDVAPAAESRFGGNSRFTEEPAQPPVHAEPLPTPRRAAATAAPAVSRESSFSQREQFQHDIAPGTEIARRNDNLTGGKPGPQTLEGLQTPTLTIQKVAPNEIQVGRPAKFEIRVRNIGRVPADRVVIRDEVPAGTNFIEASPKATRAADGAIFWDAGSLAPGQEVSVSMQLMPVTEGVIGSVATVAFESSASARTRSTKPALTIEHTGPQKVLLGEPVRFSIKISNPGTGATTNVVLEEDVPTGLSHSSGSKLEYAVGNIEPGQTRHLELTLKAAQAGQVVNTLIAKADSGLTAEHQVELEVISPQIQVAIEGPQQRYLERQATYTVAVANPGTAPANEVELMAFLPTGLKFVSTNNSGYYDQSRHAVIWSLEQLPAGEMGKAQFTAMPIEIGSFRIRAEAHAKMGLEANQERAIDIDGIAALLYTLTDKVDPIEVDGQTKYEIRVVNQGSKEATNVRIAAAAPDGLEMVQAQGPTAEKLQGQQVIFAPIESLPPKGEAVFEITVQGRAAGDHRFRVQMTSDETETPVIKEESTRVYAD